MKMTDKLANSLLNDLMCVAFSAVGGVPKNSFTEEQINLATEYAKAKFQDILSEWEELLGKSWDIVE